MSRLPSRLTGLEVLRFAAALAVLVWHYQQFLFVGIDEPVFDVRAQPFYGLLAPFYLYGYAGVEMFWCLSGFIFAWKYRTLIAERRIGGWRFAVRRFSRLYPLHLAMLLTVAFWQPRYAALHGGQDFVYVYNDLYHFILNLFFAAYWGVQKGYSFDGPAWSVSLEILVYALFFLLCRHIRGGLVRDIAVVIVAALLGALARPLLGHKIVLAGAVTFFYLGVLTARLHGFLLAAPGPWRRAVLCVAATVATVAAGLLAGHAVRIAGASLFLFPSLILLFSCWNLHHARLARLAVFCGNLTYACYLLHFPMQLIAVTLLARYALTPATWFFHAWFFLVYLGAVLIASALVYRWFETPCQTWLRARLDGRGGANAV
ncbi:MAG: acyltransferase [Rhodospirillales bacterium]|nr:acyltransferase [Rhodospirillales bacterium]